MNLTRALDVALPEIPARTLAVRYQRLHPQVVFKDHLLDGKHMVRVIVPGEQGLFTFTKESWGLIQLFDGQRSYHKIAELYCEQTNILYTADQVRELADELDAINFWYRTTQEKNIAWLQKSHAERRKLVKQKNSRWADLSMILFPAMNPDAFLDWLHRTAGFVYTGWFTLITLAGFSIMGGIFVSHWSEIARDTLEFYNFSAKSWVDIAQFWLLATVVMGIHEIGHGLTCKHYGGRVMAMGFALIYLTPAFYTDTSEGEVRGDRYQRIMITVSGVWIEMMICTVATVVWWGTPPGTTVHDFSYLLILITGIAVVLINWNPLIKLDGYYILTELLGMVDLKEESTAFVSAWVKNKIWRLPVEVSYVPRQRRIGYAVYALLSGLYSYSILFVFARFIGNVFRNFSPEWYFIPELATAALIFRSRIRTLLNFMKFVYLDKKDRVRAWFSTGRALAVGTSAAILMLLPLRHESTAGMFVLEPAHRAVLRARLPGTIAEVYAPEGQAVEAGALLVRMNNLPLQAKFAGSTADYNATSARARSAVLHYQNLGTALQDQERSSEQKSATAAEVAGLDLRSPISGVVVTPRTSDRLGAYVLEGTELVEVADLRTLRARIYVSEHDMYKVWVGASAHLGVESEPKIFKTAVTAIAPLSTESPPGLVDTSKYKGMRPPNFYVVDLVVENPEGLLKPGMVGTARVYGRPRSLAGLAWQKVGDFLGRKVW
jgi:putative peptide zinc metalloprotease protein